MKKRRALLLTLLILMLLLGIPTIWLMREVRREQASRDLIAAIKAEDTKKALAALRADADPNCRDHSDEKPLSWRRQVKRLFDKVLSPKVKSEPDQRLTALLLCIDNDSQDDSTLAKALLKAGADPNLTGGTILAFPLMDAADGNHPQTLHLLLQYGADIRQKDREGWTALHCAADNNTAEALLLLLQAGADINAQGGDIGTPLAWACYIDNCKSVEVLLQNHANPNLRYNDGDTVLDAALEHEYADIIELLRKAGAKTRKELDAQSATPPKR